MRIIVFFTFFLFTAALYPRDLSIRDVYIPDSNFRYSEPQDIFIRSGKIHSFQDIPEKRKNRKNYKAQYLFPSFCDAYVNLGSDGLGGQNGRREVYAALRSFLEHGFTHILSVADGPWIREIQGLAEKGKILSPEIQIAPRPIVPHNSETKSLPLELYFRAETKKAFYSELKKQIHSDSGGVHLFQRFSSPSHFQAGGIELYRAQKMSSRAGKILSVYAFGDRIAILNALRSGISYIHGPIPLSILNRTSKFKLQNIHNAPNFYSYYILANRGNKDALDYLLSYMQKKSPFFKKNYYPSLSSITPYLQQNPEEEQKAKEEYTSYRNFFEENLSLQKNMILSSGSGGFFAFPGIAGLMELKNIASLTGYSRDFWRIPTKNTCSYLKTEYKGRIQIREEASFLLLDANPLEDPDSIFRVKQVIRKGKILIRHR